jgi:hypothetical protein
MERQNKQEQLRRDVLASWNKCKTTDLPLTAAEMDDWLLKAPSLPPGPTSEAPLVSVGFLIEVERGPVVLHSSRYSSRNTSSGLKPRMR